MYTLKLVLYCAITLQVLKIATSCSDTGSHPCPLWTIQFNDSCVCGDDIHRTVICYGNRTLVQIFHCITYSKAFNGSAVLGHCPYNFYESGKEARNYVSTPLFVHRNHKAMCHFVDYWRKHGDPVYYEHQTGLMCTSCEDGYAYPVYSYNMACVECKDYKYNWLKYIAVAFLPLTVFYIIVVLFRITVTSGAMNGYIMICQIVTAPGNMQLISRVGQHTGIALLFSPLEIWNLNFFRGLYPPFCLHPKLTTLQTLMLDYAIAVYPLLLILLTYISVKLHNRYSIVVRLWSPFYKCFAKLRNNWDINGSLVGAFATFLLLSYVKILNVSFSILTPNMFYDVHGNQMAKRFLYYDGTYEYFGKDHIPYALLAIFMLLVFNIFPLVLLCLYPCCCFQRCLNYCRLQSLALHTFMDTFNGCYRIEPKDYRYFAGLYLFLRFLNLAFLTLTIATVYSFIAGLTFMLVIAVVAIIRPHKSILHTLADITFFTCFSVACWCMLGRNLAKDTESPYNVAQVTIVYIILPLALLLSLLYGIGFFIYSVLPKKILFKMKSFFQGCKNFITKQTDTLEADEPRPYRLDHSDEYPPLLPVATDSHTNIQYM